MATKKKDIKFILGDTRLLLIAPHGRATKPRDDINTDKITFEVARRLKCSEADPRIIVFFPKIDSGAPRTTINARQIKICPLTIKNCAVKGVKEVRYGC